MEKKVTSHVSKGLIISLILIVFSVVLHFSGQQLKNPSIGYLAYVILIGGVIWACITYGKERDHRVTFGNVFGHGFKVTAVVTCISIVFTVIFFLIFPEIKEQSLDAARLEMEKNPQMNDESIEQGLAMVSRMFFIFLIGAIIIGYLIVGAIASLIGAAVTKKTPVSPFENQLQ